MPQLHLTPAQSESFSSLQCWLSEKEASLCASGAFHFSCIDSEKHFFPSPKNPYGVFYKVTEVIPPRPVGSTVTYINMDTFHIMLSFGSLLYGETTSKKPQTHNTLLQAAASVKRLLSASIFVPILYRW